MVVRSIAAPPTPWSQNLAEPNIHETAYVHSFSNIIGDVRIGANVLVAPGTSIRADEGFPFHIGQGTNVQDGVIVHGLEKGRVVGDDGQEYSAWIGNNTCITHMALVHGPVYIGDDCFIGFRSTVFNARVGYGSIVMMHALIQDVEIPPGKYVPSGAVITNQQQADRLPDVQEADRSFAHHVVEINEALRAGYQCVEDPAGSMTALNGTSQSNSTISSINGESTANYRTPMEDGSVNANVAQQVRSLLAQGYRIGTEHADKRRFKTSSWQSCPAFEGTRPDRVLEELEACLREHQGEYVRLIGIDSKAKRRVSETIIQKPDGSEPSPSKSSFPARASSNGSGVGSLSAEVVDQVRSLLRSGHRIGTEHADKRRFKTSSWKSGSPIDSQQETQVLAELENCLAEHAGEYVRLIGIDSKAKRRVLEKIIQTPDDVRSPSGKASASFSVAASPTSGNGATAGSLSAEVVDQVRSLLAQGYKIGTEHANKRRYKTSSWQSCPIIEARQEADVLKELQACLVEHAGEYVRLIGIDSKAKRRVLETIIQRPDGTSSKPASSPASSSSNTPSAAASSNGTRNGATSNSLDREAVEQVRSLLAQGYKIGTEHANKRRFKTSSWQSGPSIESNRESEVIAALEACLSDRSGEYVRLLGIDTKSKRRVLETVIQSPS